MASRRSLSRVTALLLVLGAAGCASRHTVASPLSAERANALDRAVRSRDVRLVARPAEVYHFRSARVFLDSIVGDSRAGGEPHAFSLRTVEEFSYRNRWKGTLEGLLIGAVAGGGSMLVLSATDPAPCGIVCFTAGEIAFAGAVMGGGLGALIGAAIGSRITIQVVP